MHDENVFHNARVCINCGYLAPSCICEDTEVKPSLIILIPDIAPVSDEDTHNFDEVPAYDNLDAGDMHFLMSAIRRFLDEDKDNIDMDALNLYLQVRSMERRMERLQEEIDNHGV